MSTLAPELIRRDDSDGPEGLCRIRLYASGVLQLLDGSNCDWELASVVCWDKIAEVQSIHSLEMFRELQYARAEKLLLDTVSKDCHPAYTSTRLRGGAGCPQLLKQIKEAVNAGLY